MRVPIPNVVESCLEMDSDFTAFREAIRNEESQASAVTLPRPRGTLNLNSMAVERRKELTPSFLTVACDLPMTLKMREDFIEYQQPLAGCSDGV